MPYRKINNEQLPSIGIASCISCKKMFKVNRLSDHFREHFRPKCSQQKFGKKEGISELKFEYEQLSFYLGTNLGSQDVYARRRLEKINKEIVKRKTGSSFISMVQGGKVSKK